MKLNCKSCKYFRYYFLCILVMAIAIRFFESVSSALEVLFLVGIPILVERKRPEDLGFKNVHRGIFWGLTASFVVLIPYSLFHHPQFKLCWNSILSIFSVAFAEEVFFRGYFYSEFQNEQLVWLLTKNNLLSSILFAIAHCLVSYDYSRFVVFFPSLVMGLVFERSGSIYSSIIFHFLANLVYIC